MVKKSSNFQKLLSAVKFNLVQKDDTYLTEESQYFKELTTLMRNCVQNSESHSLLILGPPGSGKTSLVSGALNQLNRLCPSNPYILVQLNGLLQPTDNITLKEISRQLNVSVPEMEEELHSSSFAENFQIIMDVLRTSSGLCSKKPIIFILEEFDAFASHKNQFFLYNLFDISHNKVNPILVIGISRRLDVIDLLEKRVKSRFSHRQYILSNNLDFEKYSSIAKSYLSFPNNSFSWNSTIDNLFSNTSFISVLKEIYEFSPDISQLKRFLFTLIRNISASNPTFSEDDLQSSRSLHITNYDVLRFLGVSLLELCLLVAMINISERIGNEEILNFEMVHREYTESIRQRLTTIQYYDKSVVTKAFEHICDLGFLSFTSNTGNFQLKHYRGFRLQFTRTQLRNAINMHPSCPVDLKRWLQNASTH